LYFYLQKSRPRRQKIGAERFFPLASPSSKKNPGYGPEKI